MKEQTMNVVAPGSTLQSLTPLSGYVVICGGPVHFTIQNISTDDAHVGFTDLLLTSSDEVAAWVRGDGTNADRNVCADMVLQLMSAPFKPSEG